MPERQGRNLAEVQDQGNGGADAVQQPWSAAAGEHGLDDRRHGIGLRSNQGVVAGETISLSSFPLFIPVAIYGKRNCFESTTLLRLYSGDCQ